MQHQSLQGWVLCRPAFFSVHLSAISEVYRYPQEDEGNNPVMNIDLFSLEADVHRCADVRVGTHMRTPVPSHRQWECDYMVYFVCRHPLDRCICYANLDGFSVWIPNQNHILPLPLLALCRLSARRWLTTRRRRGCCIRLLSPPHVDNCLMNGRNVFLFIYLFGYFPNV